MYNNCWASKMYSLLEIETTNSVVVPNNILYDSGYICMDAFSFFQSSTKNRIRSAKGHVKQSAKKILFAMKFRFFYFSFVKRMF